MKIVQVVPSIESVGGPSYTVPLTCRALGALGDDVRLHVLGPTQARPDEPYALIAHHWLNILKRLGISPAMSRALRTEARDADILHNHGLWMMPNVYVGWAVKNTRCQLVISPRGTMARWALGRSYLQKRLFWYLFQAQSMRRAACFHATSQAEYQDLRDAGFRQPVMLIPNPLELPDNWRKEPPQANKRLLYLGRIHPIKGLQFLLEAWAAVQDQYPDWYLDIAGPDNDGYTQELQRLADKLGLQRLAFLGPAFGAEKDALYARSSLYVLPTHTENFGVTVAEALARQVPVITTHGAPWEGLHQHDCGWWIPIGTAPLIDCLHTALKAPNEELQAMGERGQAWVRATLSQESIGTATREAYEWLLSGGTPPAHLILD